MADLRTLLSEAVRYNDAQAEERGFEGVVSHIFGETDTVLHVAQQRAMRYVLIGEGQPINEETMRSVLIDPGRRALMVRYMPIFLDGLCAGWEAHRRQAG